MIKFNILGAPENDEVENRINNYIKTKDISDFLIFHGLKFDEAKYELFKRCSYFIFLSQFENLPVVLKEAITAKMAIIASDIKANDIVLEVLDTNYCSFNVDDSQSLAKRKLISIIDELSNEG